MTAKIFSKDLRLAAHPMMYVFALFGVMLIIPNYPYTVVFFYGLLGIFFTFLNGRENKDVYYCAVLPVTKRDQVRARAHIPGITIGDLDAMREAVRYERRVEFPVEAVNFFDEVRWGTYKETKSPGLRRGGYTPPNRPITRKAGSRRRNPSTSWSWRTLPTCESFWSRISRTPTASFRRKTAPKPSPSSKNRPAT